ncbi:hypothetical protein P171DRAFT_5772 [Karstenula rhodostoma CBS 690.94]|uniref:Uncharacterized protein n=1 Tax=Karstenula rhodostoma CBS 690.94 TaxID=1392251 RepID=A0A9P4PW77_9PLEO|nr:hypothetical protein P171DRAFT_5772 [Karstenula rhodostoma CBS 690.94]
MSPPHSRSRSQPRRTRHYFSISFSTPENVVPQLYEWVSTSFPFSVIVHHYSIYTTHAPQSLPSLTPSGTSARLSHSSSSSAGSDPDPNDSLLTEFDENADFEDYGSPSESSLEEPRTRLHVSAGEGDTYIEITPRRDPWTTWFPPTPPPHSREALRAESTAPAPLFSSPGVIPSVRVDTLGMHRSEMGAIDEDEVEVAENQLQQELMHEQTRAFIARPHVVCAGLPDNEADFAQLIDEERDSPRGSCLCWACRAILQRYARRHDLFL